MSAGTKIEWTDASWNPVTGCTRVSPGCQHCYAERLTATRLAHQERYRGLAVMQKGEARWSNEVRLHREVLDDPLRWERQRRVFVCSMSDLFHADVPDGYIMDVWRIMYLAAQHVFQVLTKRSDRMAGWLRRWLDTSTDEAADSTDSYSGIPYPMPRGPAAIRATYGCSGRAGLFAEMLEGWGDPPPGAAWPLYDWAQGPRFWPRVFNNVWLGVSVEDREHLRRIEDLRDTPAVVRWVSFEPLLEDLGNVDLRGVDWAVIGGETGPGARPLDVGWARRLIEQCRAQGVKVFVKQLGRTAVESQGHCSGCDMRTPDDCTHCEGTIEHPQRLRLRDSRGRVMDEWPADLRIREWPNAARA